MTPTDLVDIATAKTWLNITDDSQDNVIQQIITMASLAINNTLNRQISIGSYNEFYDGTGTNRLCPINFPITNITALSIDGVSVARSFSQSARGFQFDGSTIWLTGGMRYTPGCKNVSVIYSAGYSIIPYDIIQATLMTIQSMVSMRLVDPNVAAENSGGGYSVTYKDTAGNVPSGAKDLLKNYKRVTW